METKNVGEKQGQLQRNLSLFEATMFGISFVIGTGVFLKPSVVLENSGSTQMAIIMWIVAGLISLCSALTIAEIAAYIPKLGGLYTYLSELYGEAIGFLYGWVTILVSGPGGAAASAIAFATFASYFIKLSSTGMRILSISVVILFGIIQILSTKGAMKLQVAGTIGKLAPIFAILFFGFFQKNIPGSINMDLISNSKSITISGALIGALWAYDGWVSTCTLGEELVNSEKNLPKAIIIALVFVTAVYALFNVVIFRNIPANTIVGSENIGVDVAKSLFGHKGATLVSVGVLISSVVTMNAQMMNNERNILPMAQRQLLPGHQILSKISPKFDTPVPCIILQIILTCIYIFSGTFETVTNMVIFVVWVFFTLAVFGVFILRKKYPRKDGLYSTPLYPVIPILGIFGGSYLVISTLISMFKLSMIGIIVALIGLPIYLYYKNKK
ncbi:MAG: amino acid permease [Tissierellia bacterium]|nr:amino acid permease [Tissierellia bacterium]